MACIQPTSALLVSLLGPRKLKLSFVYEGNQHVGFYVQLYKYDPVVEYYRLFRKFFVPGHVREFFFNLIHMGTAQKWKAYVEPLCVGCWHAMGQFSNEVIIA